MNQNKPYNDADLWQPLQDWDGKDPAWKPGFALVRKNGHWESSQAKCSAAPLSAGEIRHAKDLRDKRKRKAA